MCIVSSTSQIDQREPATKKSHLRILCLGNDLLGDDSLGSVVAAQLREFAPADVEVVYTPETGFDLLDYLLNVSRVVVVDTVLAGSAPPGTIFQIRDSDLESFPGASPHYVGLFEALAVARFLRLHAAEDVLILAVEMSDCYTVGADMQPAVAAAIPVLISMLREKMDERTRAVPAPSAEQAIR